MFKACFWFSCVYICAVNRLVFRLFVVGLYASMLANNGILTACNLYYLHSFIPLHESIEDSLLLILVH